MINIFINSINLALDYIKVNIFVENIGYIIINMFSNISTGVYNYNMQYSNPGYLNKYYSFRSYSNYHVDNFYYINNAYRICENFYNEYKYYVWDLLDYDIPHINNIALITCSMFFYDYILCYIFGNKARWFQLHAFVNLIITIDILPSIIGIINNIETGYALLTNHTASYYVYSLHFYHVLTFKNLSMYDYFHHALFVGLGTLPAIVFIKYNQILVTYISCCGIPGIIEYGTLALYKNQKISLYRQKYICSLLYIFLRFPMCIFGIATNIIAHNKGYIKDYVFFSIYLNLMLYLNGTIFTYLTLESFYKIKYKYSNLKVYCSDKEIQEIQENHLKNE